MHFSLILIARPDQRIDDMMEPFYESWDEDDPRTVEGVDEDGDTYFYNPDAMWDWYEVGGRWTGLIEADGRVDCARVSTNDRQERTARRVRQGRDVQDELQGEVPGPIPGLHRMGHRLPRLDAHARETCQAFAREGSDMRQLRASYNEDGENVVVYRTDDATVTETYQDNGWIRVNIEYDDGFTEELYKR